jgi:hypothetical protein
MRLSTGMVQAMTQPKPKPPVPVYHPPYVAALHSIANYIGAHHLPTGDDIVIHRHGLSTEQFEGAVRENHLQIRNLGRGVRSATIPIMDHSGVRARIVIFEEHA